MQEVAHSLGHPVKYSMLQKLVWGSHRNSGRFSIFKPCSKTAAQKLKYAISIDAGHVASASSSSTHGLLTVLIICDLNNYTNSGRLGVSKCSACSMHHSAAGLHWECFHSFWISVTVVFTDSEKFFVADLSDIARGWEASPWPIRWIIMDCYVTQDEVISQIFMDPLLHASLCKKVHSNHIDVAWVLVESLLGFPSYRGAALLPQATPCTNIIL